MNNKKGFTLIELLAVIVILAVIALIATPLIMNVIDEAKKGAANNSANGVIEAGALKLAHDIESVTSGAFQGKTYTETSNLEFKGTKPSKFTLTFNEKGETEFKGFISGYCITKSFENSEVEIDESKKTADDCVNDGAKVFANGEPIYFDPATGKSCDNYTDANSLNENKIGCLKWYTFNDKKESDRVNAILDHNTTSVLSFLDPQTELDALVDEANWKLTPRIIGVNEIVQITGNSTFDIDHPETAQPYFFETNSQEVPPFIDMENPNSSAQGKATYAWLFDYTDDCTYFGCNVDYNGNRSRVRSTVMGYATLPQSSTQRALSMYWVVDSRGILTQTGSFDHYGIRPVIEIPKTLLN